MGRQEREKHGCFLSQEERGCEVVMKKNPLINEGAREQVQPRIRAGAMSNQTRLDALNARVTNAIIQAEHQTSIAARWWREVEAAELALSRLDHPEKDIAERGVKTASLRATILESLNR